MNRPTAREVRTQIEKIAKDIAIRTIEDITEEMNNHAFGEVLSDDGVFDLILLGVSIKLMKQKIGK